MKFYKPRALLWDFYSMTLTIPFLELTNQSSANYQQQVHNNLSIFFVFYLYLRIFIVQVFLTPVTSELTDNP